MKVTAGALAVTTIALLANHLLPAFAEVQKEVNPDTTSEELTATLETDGRDYVAKRFGEEQAALVFDIPFIRAGLDKEIKAIVTKALPVVKKIEAVGEQAEEAAGSIPLPSLTSPAPASISGEPPLDYAREFMPDAASHLPAPEPGVVG